MSTPSYASVSLQTMAEEKKAATKTVEGFHFDPTYLDIQGCSDCIFIQLTLNEERAVERKQRFHKAVADGLHQRLSLRREDVFVNLVEVTKENWSFG